MTTRSVVTTSRGRHSRWMPGLGLLAIGGLWVFVACSSDSDDTNDANGTGGSGGGGGSAGSGGGESDAGGCTGDSCDAGAGGPCASDPCGVSDGRATACSAGADESYTCECDAAASFVAADGPDGATCACDLNGVFAIRIERTMSWGGIISVEPGTDTIYSWAIRQHNYEPDGTLSVETIPCGETFPDLCGTGDLLPAEAYAQFTPTQIFGADGMPTDCHGGTCPEMSLPLALPGDAFETPETATILGLTLDDPLGDWPASRQNVDGGTDTQTNGAVWEDHDGDSEGALTLYAIPPGGPGSLSVDPLIAYTATSDVCPRAGGDPLDFAFWPALDGLTIRRVVRFHAASRVVSALSGQITSCDLIEGDVTGPANGQVMANARFHGCVRCDTGEDESCPEVACEDSVIDFLDGQDQSLQQVDSASFVIKRIPSDSTCADVRAMDFP